MAYRVLWIDDQALTEAAPRTAPVYAEGKYELDFALTPSQGLQKLEDNLYDVIIVDIRFYPSDQDNGPLDTYDDDYGYRRGIPFLYKILGYSQDGRRESQPLITVSRLGVISVETRSEMQPHLKKLNIKHFRHTQFPYADTILLDLIEEILKAAEVSEESDV